MAGLQHTHCSECGTVFPQTKSFPRKCTACDKIKWINPVPVAVMLQPLTSSYSRFFSRKGLAVAFRAIDPGAGMLGLIGGFVDMTDKSIEDGATREFKEETNLFPKSKPKLSYSAANGVGNILMFCTIDKPMHIDEWYSGKPCSETLSLDALWEDTWEDRLGELAFPLHKQAIAKWFRGELK